MDEEQFILRLPPTLTDRMRLLLGNKAVLQELKDRGQPVPTFAIRFTDDRHAVCVADGTEYPATLMDLPTVCETHKTIDKKTFYKSRDVHQVLVVRMPDDPPPPEGQYSLPDGLSPAAAGARDRFKSPAPPFAPEEVSSLEAHLKYVMEKKIQFVQKPADAPGSDNKKKNEGAAKAASGGGGGSGDGTISHKRKPAKPKAPDASSGGAAAGGAAPAPEKSPETAAESAAAAEATEKAEDEIDDFADMLAQDMMDTEGDGAEAGFSTPVEAKGAEGAAAAAGDGSRVGAPSEEAKKNENRMRLIEIQRAEAAVLEAEKPVKELEEKVKRAMNDVLRGRLQATLGEKQKVLDEKRRILEELKKPA